MNGPTGYNVRYRWKVGHALVVLRVSPSTLHNALQVANLLSNADVADLEIWRSGEKLHQNWEIRKEVV